jgi:uncharacterized protein YunC (DUF1805 family)
MGFNRATHKEGDNMSEQDFQAVDHPRSIAMYVVGTVVAVFMVVSGYTNYKLSERLGQMEERQTASEQIQQKIRGDVSTATTSAQALAQRIGMTQKELIARTRELQRQERAAEQRLAEQQKATDEKFGQISGDVATVKTDVGGMRTDLSTARGDIDATKAKLDRTIGDLGIQSGLIAHTSAELEVLKHRGDRNYYEFTLTKKKRTPVSTVSLELRKADAKKGKYTLIVLSDDRPIEKKDRTMNEPVQFYTGRDRMLYELVVNQVNKNTVVGYLSTPKAAPQPVNQ